MLQNKPLRFVLLVFILFGNYAYSQTLKDREYIKSESNLKKLKELENSFSTNYANLLKRAKTLNIPTKLYSKGIMSGSLDEIKNGVPYYDSETNEKAAISSKVNNLWSGGSLGLSLTGKNITIGHWETSGLPLASHVELSGRIVSKDAVGPSSHATHTAGTMIAKGIVGEARGMASEAIIHARNSSNDEAEMAAFGANGGIVSNHSYGQTARSDTDIRYYGYYSDSAREWDQIAYNAPYYLICRSAGNNRDNGYNSKDGGYDILLKKATAKNVLVIGAVKDVENYNGAQSVQQTAFSSYGPTDDFRIKPDLMANGYKVYSSDYTGNNAYDDKSGTSMATPVVTGTVALLQEHYHKLNSKYMKSATVKALLINSADELGGHPGPDFANGWGLLNAEKAARQIGGNSSTSLLLEENLENNDSFSKTIEVDGNSPLFVTIAWTDVAGTPIPFSTMTEDQSDSMLVNDLDIRISGNGQTYMPWTFTSTTSFTNAAVRGDNARDNVEKIEIADIDAGTYTITVTHKGELEEDEQAFSLVIDGIKEGTLSTKDFAVNESLIMYPNPSGGIVYVNNLDGSDIFTKVQVFDLKGSIIKSYDEHKLRNNNNAIQIDNKGIYFVRATSLKRSLVKKILIH